MNKMMFKTSIFLASLSLAAAGGQGNGNGNGNDNGNSGFGGFGDGGTTNDGDPNVNLTPTATIPLTQNFIRSVNGSEDPRSAPDAELIRLSGPANYPDGVGNGLNGVEPSFPNARLISNMVSDPETLPPNAQPGKSRGSDMLWQWGQFMDHDIGLTEEVATNSVFTVTSPDCTNDVICTIGMRRCDIPRVPPNTGHVMFATDPTHQVVSAFVRALRWQKASGDLDHIYPDTLA
jgi:hypothetical protein